MQESFFLCFIYLFIYLLSVLQSGSKGTEGLSSVQTLWL